MIFTVPAPEPEAVFTTTEPKRFYKTFLEVEVLTEEQYDPKDLATLGLDIYYNSPIAGGRVRRKYEAVLSGADAASELIACGSDPDAFGLDEHGNDLDESDGPDDDVEQVPLDDDPEVFDTEDDEEENEEEDYEEDPEPVMV